MSYPDFIFTHTVMMRMRMWTWMCAGGLFNCYALAYGVKRAIRTHLIRDVHLPYTLPSTCIGLPCTIPWAMALNCFRPFPSYALAKCGSFLVGELGRRHILCEAL